MVKDKKRGKYCYKDFNVGDLFNTKYRNLGIFIVLKKEKGMYCEKISILKLETGELNGLSLSNGTCTHPTYEFKKLS